MAIVQRAERVANGCYATHEEKATEKFSAQKGKFSTNKNWLVFVDFDTVTNAFLEKRIKTHLKVRWVEQFYSRTRAPLHVFNNKREQFRTHASWLKAD